VIDPSPADEREAMLKVTTTICVLLFSLSRIAGLSSPLFSQNSSIRTTEEVVDFLIVPGVSVGAVTRQTTEEQLKSLYDEEEVTRIDVELGEGFTEKGTALFPNDPTRTLHILWNSDTGTPSEIYLKGTVWRTADGIGKGTSLKELEDLNGGPFTLLGFMWDYSGTVVSWNGGTLEDKLNKDGRVLLRLIPPEGTDDLTVAGAREFLSAHPVMQALNPEIYSIRVEF